MYIFTGAKRVTVAYPCCRQPL